MIDSSCIQTNTPCNLGGVFLEIPVPLKCPLANIMCASLSERRGIVGWAEDKNVDSSCFLGFRTRKVVFSTLKKWRDKPHW